MRFTEILQEDVVNFTDRGIPREFAENLLKRFKINNDAEIESIEGKPKSSDIERGDLIINTQQGDEVVAVLKQVFETFDMRFVTIYHRITYQDGEFEVEEHSKLADAAKGMTSRGGAEFLRISSQEIRISNKAERDAKPTDDEIRKRQDSEDALAGGTVDIYAYMNKTFMPKMRAQMETMVDEIYANIRKLDKTKNRWGNKRSDTRQKNQQEEAIAAAGAIESIAGNGFSRETMAEFLKTFGKYHSGFGSIPRNEQELEKLLQNEPNARAKWAKIVLASAKNHLSRVKQMAREPVMRGLRGEG
jgi:hypothetical protein